jgi:hypothetical protein
MDDFLVDHINKGWSYLAIATEIRRTYLRQQPLSRNAVAGRKYRLIKAGREMKVPDHRSAVIHSNKQRAIKPKERKEKKAVTKKIIPTAPPPEETRVRNRVTGQLKPVRPGVLPLTPNPKTILELGYRQCRAAVGEGPRMHDGINNPFMFCGARTDEGETYCPDHAFLMYTKPKPKTEHGFILGRISTNKRAA